MYCVYIEPEDVIKFPTQARDPLLTASASLSEAPHYTLCSCDDAVITCIAVIIITSTTLIVAYAVAINDTNHPR